MKQYADAMTDNMIEQNILVKKNTKKDELNTTCKHVSSDINTLHSRKT